jgi:hypothetical protein
MRKEIQVGLLGLGVLAYTFTVWSIGFMKGVDGTLCVVAVLQDEDVYEDVPNCQRLDTGTPFMIMQRNLPDFLKRPS